MSNAIKHVIKYSTKFFRESIHAKVFDCPTFLECDDMVSVGYFDFDDSHRSIWINFHRTAIVVSDDNCYYCYKIEWHDFDVVELFWSVFILIETKRHG